MFEIGETPIYENARTEIHGELIKQMIKASGIPMNHVWAALGISQKTLCNRFHGKTRFSGDEITELAHLLNPEIQDLCWLWGATPFFSAWSDAGNDSYFALTPDGAP